MTGRDLSGPVTVINRFTVKGDVDKFEREFRTHSQFLRHQPEFGYLVTVQLVDDPQVYVHLGHWNSLQGFLRVVHDETFLAHVQRLGAMVETEADQAVSVGRVLRQNAVVGAANVVLTHGEVSDSGRDFEQLFAESVRTCEKLDGFGGSDLLRSTVSPLTYLGLMWWYDTESCDNALDSDAYREHQAELARIARVRTERTRHVAYERVITG